ncbi:hypothetical protein BTO03_26200 [Vibrio parahaemolyticus]|nr:hypothetical protein BTM22_26155 [Vibrio parahaemolyticus]OUJ48465.1 hypothetical protein BTO03_26200 [Vibrio parahaemolyticus]
MGASLNEQCRVSEEGLRTVKLCCRGKRAEAGNGFCWMVPGQKATANYVPAAAVIRRWRALSGMIGRKGCAGGLFSLKAKG